MPVLCCHAGLECQRRRVTRKSPFFHCVRVILQRRCLSTRYDFIKYKSQLQQRKRVALN